MSFIRRLVRWTLTLSLLGLLVGGIAFAVLYYSVSSKLPPIDTLRTTELQEPLYVYARDGRLIGLFGETRRYPVEIAKVPKRLKDAFIAIEDARFYEHHGVDYKGVARAVWLLATTDDKRVPGGSTITQQVARQYFLSSEYKLKRKFAEMLLAMKMERELGKDEIFELYLNKSFFGNRAYGVAAAAEYYYGKPLDQLTLDEMASLASIPKFPSSGNPISNPERAKIRRDYVLQRMAELKMITPAEAQAAQAVPMHATPHERPIEVSAPFIAEMVRQEMIDRFGGDALTKGYHVVTTIDPVMQAAADKAVRDGLGAYDHRHGWNAKALPHIDIPAGEDAKTAAARLRDHPTQGELMAALVLSVDKDSAEVVLADGATVRLGPETSRWAGRSPGALLKRGDVARVRRILPAAADTSDKTAAAKPATPDPAQPVKYQLDQLPRAQSALVSLEADTGALRALVGGYSYAGSKFNNATQARRQPGSSFKPFVYAAAFERGFNPASIVLDAPVVFRDRRGKMWRPQNDGGGFAGPVRVREALVQSRNLVSVRMLDAIGVDYALRYITQFGFEEAELPRNLSISLGTPSLSPLSIARGYATFANGGFRITPWFIDEVRDRNGKVIFKEKPATACRGCTTGNGVAGQPTAGAPQVVDGFDLGPAGGSAPTPEKPGKDVAGKPTTKPAQPAVLPPDTVIAPRAIDERIAYQMISMMRDVVLRGTATDAKRLGREDIGGKTGSTNNHRDAWFSGTGGSLITTVWVGKSDNTSLGYREYGGKAALPIWIDYMKVALKDAPIAPNEPPQGMVRVAVTAGGQLLPTESAGGIIEYVKAEDLEKMENFVDYGPQDEMPSEEAFDIF